MNMPSIGGGIGNVSAYGQPARRKQATGLPGVPAPEFGPGKMMTKTTPTRSDEEIKNAVIALAKRDAARGVNGFGDDDGNSSKEYENLTYEFISSHSPDREGIFAKRMNEVKAALQPNPFKMPEITSFMDLVLKGNGEIGGNTNTGELSMITFTDGPLGGGGAPLGSWSSTYGWGYSPTNEEIARRGEIANLYLDTWKAAAEGDSAQTSMPATAISGSVSTSISTDIIC